MNRLWFLRRGSVQRRSGTRETDHALIGQIVRFSAVGIIATLFHYLVALALSWELSVFLANLMGFAAGFNVSYFGHHRFTFRLSKEAANHRRRLPRFIVLQLCGLAISEIVLTAMVVRFQFPSWLALIWAVLIVPTFTFLASRSWVFSSAMPISGLDR